MGLKVHFDHKNNFLQLKIWLSIHNWKTNNFTQVSFIRTILVVSENKAEKAASNKLKHLSDQGHGGESNCTALYVASNANTVITVCI